MTPLPDPSFPGHRRLTLVCHDTVALIYYTKTPLTWHYLKMNTEKRQAFNVSKETLHRCTAANHGALRDCNFVLFGQLARFRPLIWTGKRVKTASMHRPGTWVEGLSRCQFKMHRNFKQILNLPKRTYIRKVHDAQQFSTKDQQPNTFFLCKNKRWIFNRLKNWLFKTQNKKTKV